MRVTRSTSEYSDLATAAHHPFRMTARSAELRQRERDPSRGGEACKPHTSRPTGPSFRAIRLPARVTQRAVVAAVLMETVPHNPAQGPGPSPARRRGAWR